MRLGVWYLCLCLCLCLSLSVSVSVVCLSLYPFFAAGDDSLDQSQND
jgi:hypothetical protein